MTGIDSNDVLVLRTTDAALAKVLELRAGEDSEESLALWVEVSGSSRGAYTYDMYFQAASEARPQDWSDERRGLVLVVPADSIAKMRGATLDVNRDLLQGGMVIQNPNQPLAPAGSGSFTARTHIRVWAVVVAAWWAYATHPGGWSPRPKVMRRVISPGERRRPIDTTSDSTGRVNSAAWVRA